MDEREQRRDGLDVKRIVGFVLLASTLGMVFFVFFFLISTTDDDVPDEVPGWRGNAYTGVVVEIDATHLVLHTTAGDNIRFKVDSNARYITRSNEAVKPGDEAKVNFRNVRGPEGPYMQARTIRVLKTEIENPAPTESAGPSARPSRSPLGSPSARP